jgi:hypothetical protein
VPTFGEGDIVIMDNLGSYKRREHCSCCYNAVHRKHRHESDLRSL